MMTEKGKLMGKEYILSFHEDIKWSRSEISFKTYTQYTSTDGSFVLYDYSQDSDKLAVEVVPPDLSKLSLGSVIECSTPWGGFSEICKD